MGNDLFSSTHAVLSQNAMWWVFSIAVIALLALDLFGFNRKNEEPHFWHTFWVCVFYIVIAIMFGFFVMYEEGSDKGMLL